MYAVDYYRCDGCGKKGTQWCDKCRAFEAVEKDATVTREQARLYITEKDDELCGFGDFVATFGDTDTYASSTVRAWCRKATD